MPAVDRLDGRVDESRSYFHFFLSVYHRARATPYQQCTCAENSQCAQVQC
jgi:hypothetical protein